MLAGCPEIVLEIHSKEQGETRPYKYNAKQYPKVSESTFHIKRIEECTYGHTVIPVDQCPAHSSSEKFLLEVERSQNRDPRLDSVQSERFWNTES